MCQKLYPCSGLCISRVIPNATLSAKSDKTSRNLDQERSGMVMAVRKFVLTYKNNKFISNHETHIYTYILSVYSPFSDMVELPLS